MKGILHQRIHHHMVPDHSQKNVQQNRCGSNNGRCWQSRTNERNKSSSFHVLVFFTRIYQCSCLVGFLSPVSLSILWCWIRHRWFGWSNHGEWVCNLDEKQERVKRKCLVGIMNIGFTSKMMNTYKYMDNYCTVKRCKFWRTYLWTPRCELFYIVVVIQGQRYGTQITTPDNHKRNKTHNENSTIQNRTRDEMPWTIVMNR